MNEEIISNQEIVIAEPNEASHVQTTMHKQTLTNPTQVTPPNLFLKILF